MTVKNDVGYMCAYHKCSTISLGKAYLVWSIQLGLVHVEFERDETICDGIARCVHENGLIMPSHLIVATWPKNPLDATNHTYTVYRLTHHQELRLGIMATIYRSHSSRPAFMS